MATLYGKGIWVLYSADLDGALEMADKIGATHLLCRAGYQAMFFPAAAREMEARVRGAGLVPFAWQPIGCDDPPGEARVALKIAEAGFDGIVFDVGQQAAGRQANAQELGQRLLGARLNPVTLYVASFPDISRHADMPYAEMSAFCRGGFMPRSFPTLGKPAEVVIHKMTYEEHAGWEKGQGCPAPLYPVLAAHRDEGAEVPLAPDAFAHWVDVLTEHAPTFFSVFHASAAGPAYWPALARVTPPQPVRVPLSEPVVLPALEPERKIGPASSPVPTEQGVYVAIRAGDTITGLCQLHGCTWAQFWAWNARLWDERGLPHDPDYMQAGWRVRVG